MRRAAGLLLAVLSPGLAFVGVAAPRLRLQPLNPSRGPASCEEYGDPVDLLLLTCSGLEDGACDAIARRLGVPNLGTREASASRDVASGVGRCSIPVEFCHALPAAVEPDSTQRGGEAAVGKVVLRLRFAGGAVPGRPQQPRPSLAATVAELEACCGVQASLALVCAGLDVAPTSNAVTLAGLEATLAYRPGALRAAEATWRRWRHDAQHDQPPPPSPPHGLAGIDATASFSSSSDTVSSGSTSTSSTSRSTSLDAPGEDRLSVHFRASCVRDGTHGFKSPAIMAALASGALEATLQPLPQLQACDRDQEAPPSSSSVAAGDCVTSNNPRDPRDAVVFFDHRPWVANLRTYDLELLGVLHHARLSVGLLLRPPAKRRKYSTLMSEGAGGPAATAAAAAEGGCS